MIYQFAEIQDIIVNNPNKDAIAKGRAMADKLMLHLHGVGMKSAIKHCEHFVSKELYAVQKEYAVSNKDLFARLLQQEDMVFSTNGGMSSFGMQGISERTMNALLDDVRYNMTLRKWIKTFALEAYRADPMGIIFMEIEQLLVNDEGVMNEPKCYPTYKTIYSIFDYYSTGRNLEHVCFKLSASDAIEFGVRDPELKKLSPNSETEYYRFVDDARDYILQKKDSIVLLAPLAGQNPIVNIWNKTPGFIVSDLVQFNSPQIFLSPLDAVIELADCFLYDRSVRDLQKKYHGFAKPIEPLLKCGTCAGTGFVGADPCPDCTQPGAKKGTGYKMRTKVADVTKFDLSVFKESGFDFHKIYGYVTPDIAGWEKQDMSLSDLQHLMEMTYWGTARMTQQETVKQTPTQEETATKTMVNQQPKYAKLNVTADWGEKTEKIIADFIGKFWFGDSFKQSAITYGRDYILETADDIMQKYQDMRQKGAPIFSMRETLTKYYRALYQNNPAELAKYLKRLDVEPFPFMSPGEAKANLINQPDINAKFYFDEWTTTIPDESWLVLTSTELRIQLNAYVAAKNIQVPEPVPAPTF